MPKAIIPCVTKVLKEVETQLVESEAQGGDYSIEDIFFQIRAALKNEFPHYQWENDKNVCDDARTE